MCRAAAAALNFAAETKKFFMSNIDKIHDSPVASATCAQAVPPARPGTISTPSFRTITALSRSLKQAMMACREICDTLEHKSRNNCQFICIFAI